MGTSQPSEPRRRRERGDDGISWDKINNCYVGTVSLGYDGQGQRRRRTVRGRTKAEVKDKLKKLHEEISAGIRTTASYTIRECVSDWLDELTFDPHTMATYRGQAEKWIYPKIGGAKLKDFKVAEAERFFREIAEVLSKRSLMMVKSTLRRSIRRAQKHGLIGKNVAELVDLPEGQPGRPSRAMTEEQAGKVLATAKGTGNAYVKVIRIGEARTAATHAATEDDQVACGNKPRKNAKPAEISADLHDTTCRACRAQLGIDDSTDASPRLEALFVLSITLGLRPLPRTGNRQGRPDGPELVGGQTRGRLPALGERRCLLRDAHPADPHRMVHPAGALPGELRCRSPSHGDRRSAGPHRRAEPPR